MLVFLSVFQGIAALASSPDTTQCDLGDEQSMLLKRMVISFAKSSALCFLRVYRKSGSTADKFWFFLGKFLLCSGV